MYDVATKQVSSCVVFDETESEKALDSYKRKESETACVYLRCLQNEPQREEERKGTTPKYRLSSWVQLFKSDPRKPAAVKCKTQ